MKTLLAIAAVALVGLTGAPRAEAGHSSSPYTYRSGHASCGCPTYSTRHFRGYNSCRQPVYSYVRLALRHGSSCRHSSHYRSSSYYSHGSSRYVPRVSIRTRSYSRGHSSHNRGYSSSSRGYSRSGYSSGRTCR